MRKLFTSLLATSILCGGFIAVTSVSAHSNDCKEVEFDHETVCVSISQVHSDTFELTTERVSGTTSTLRCDIMTPDSSLQVIGSCNGEFSYNDSKSGKIKLWIRANEEAPTDWEDKPSSSDSIWTYPQWMYDFSNEEWLDSNNDTNNSNGDLDNFYLTTDDTTPTTSQYVDLSIKARDNNDDTVTDYTDMVNFKVYKRASGSSTWTLTTSSSDFVIDTDYDNGYDFTSSDDGDVTLTNFIQFKRNNYSYKVKVYDENDTTIYKEITFTVGTNNNNSNGDLDNFYLTTDDTTPTTSQYVDLGIEARDNNDDTVTDYTDMVNFKVYKRASGSSTWTLTTSSSDFVIKSSYDNGYDFTSSDDGDVTLTNFIQFKRNNYSYKVKVYDENDTTIYKEITFTVGTNNNNGNPSNVGGFTTSQLTTVQSLYNGRNHMISDLEDNYSILRNSSTWNNRSDTFYDDMRDILDDVSNRTYDTYSKFMDGWTSWYSYTINLRS